MAFRLGEAFVEFKQRGLTSVKSSADQAARSLTGARNAARAFSMVLGAASIGAFGAKLIKLASDAEETQNRFDAVFKDQSEAVERWADNLAKEFGRARGDILSGLSSFQSFFVGMGFGADQAAEFSKQLQRASIDFASFNNLSDEEAMQRFIQAMSGSSEVLMKFGINTQEIALKQELLRMGIKKSSSEITQQEKAMARLNIILRSMGEQGATGDAARTADAFANQLKRLRSNAKQLGIELGQVLLPAVTDVVQQLNEFISTVKSIKDADLAKGFDDTLTAIEKHTGTPLKQKTPEEYMAEYGIRSFKNAERPMSTIEDFRKMQADAAKLRAEANEKFLQSIFDNASNLAPAYDAATQAAQRMGQAIVEAADAQRQANVFAERNVDIQDRIDVLLGKMSEKTSRMRQLMREGFTGEQAQKLAEQEARLKELMDQAAKDKKADSASDVARRAQFTDARGINRLVQMAVSGEDMSKLQKEANGKLDKINESNTEIAGSLKKGIKVEALPMG